MEIVLGLILGIGLSIIILINIAVVSYAVTVRLLNWYDAYAYRRKIHQLNQAKDDALRNFAKKVKAENELIG